jgi:carboxyl-terminal processing protease
MHCLLIKIVHGVHLLEVRMQEEFNYNRNEQTQTKGFLSGILCSLAVICAVFIALVCVVKFGNYHILIYKSSSSENTEAVDAIDLSEVVSKIESINQLIDDVYLFDYDTTDMVDNIYKGYVAGIGDPYTSYYTEEEYQSLMESSTGTYKGIGVSISSEDGKILIKEVFADGPAQKAGIVAEDEIKGVNGKDVSEFETVSDLVQEIRGNDATKATLTIYRSSTDETMEVELTLEDVDTNTVNYKMLDNGIGYLQITKFETVTIDQFKNAMEDLKSQGMTSLTLDLRDNPGGTLTAVVDIADYLLPEGNILSIEDKNGNTKEYTSDASALDMPMTVLINGNSASASEVLAGAIKDYGAGTLIGTKSFGKGIVQNIYPLGDGTGVKITIAKYYTPAGNYIHGEGITPDIEIEEEENSKEDKVLEKAIEVLTKGE